jgi:dTMP kinase
VLIAIDGIYSAGKSTLIEIVLARLRDTLAQTVALTDWNSSALVGELIPGWKRDGRLGPHSLLFAEAADLAHRCETAIVPQLDSGGIVVADRYVLSGTARAVVRGVDPEFATQVFDFAPRESLTVLVECRPETTLARRRRLGKVLGGYHSGRDFRRSDSVEDDFVRYQAEMSALYRSLAPERGPVVSVDTERQSVEECADEVLRTVAAQLAETARPV